jgi:hypothetical protein
MSKAFKVKSANPRVGIFFAYAFASLLVEGFIMSDVTYPLIGNSRP